MEKGCKKLISLDMSKNPQISIQGYYSVAKGFPCMQTIKLNLNYTICDQAVIQTVQKLTNLKEINIQKCIELTDSSVKYLAETRTLTKISIDQLHRVSDGALRALAKYCPNLEEISIVDCARITDVTMKVIAQLENLKILSISDCARISDTGLRYLAEGNSVTSLANLDCTNVSRLTDISLFRIAKFFTNIKKLSLAYCENISDTGIEHLLSLPTLNDLDLSGTPLQDDTLAKIGKMANINKLVISECPYISDTGLGKFCTRIKEKLQLLDISHCKDITDKPMKIVAYNCRFLKNINLAGCWRLTDETPMCLSSVCDKIESFDLSGCYQITDGSLKYLKKLKNLKLLILKFCRNVTATGFYMIKDYVPEVYYDHDDAPGWFGYDKIPYLSTMEAGDIKPKGDFLDKKDDSEKRKKLFGNSANAVLGLKKAGKKGKKKKGKAAGPGLDSNQQSAASSRLGSANTQTTGTSEFDTTTTGYSTRPQTAKSRKSSGKATNFTGNEPLPDIADVTEATSGLGLTSIEPSKSTSKITLDPLSISSSRRNSGQSNITNISKNNTATNSRRSSKASSSKSKLIQDGDEDYLLDSEIESRNSVTRSFSLTDGSFYKFNIEAIQNLTLPEDLAEVVESRETRTSTFSRSTTISRPRSQISMGRRSSNASRGSSKMYNLANSQKRVKSAIDFTVQKNSEIENSGPIEDVFTRLSRRSSEASRTSVRSSTGFLRNSKSAK